jgi:hypothetical protein
VEMAQDKSGRAGVLGKVTVYVLPGLAADDRKVGKITTGGPAGEARPGELKPVLRDKIARTVSELYQLPTSQVAVVKMN